MNDGIERTLEIDVKMAKDIHTHNRQREREEGPIHLGPFVIAWVVCSHSLCTPSEVLNNSRNIDIAMVA